MVLSINTSLPIKKILELCTKYFGEYKNQNSFLRKKLKKTFPVFEKTLHKDTHQAHRIIGGISYDAMSKNRIGMILLNNILGGPAMNSRLNLGIREKYGFTYTIESGYSAYSDTGIFHVYFGTEKEKLDRTHELVVKEFKKLTDKKLSTSQLNQYKTQLKGQFILSQENRMSVALGLGKSLLTYDKIDTFEKVIKMIESVSAEQLLAISNEVLPSKNHSVLTYL